MSDLIVLVLKKENIQKVGKALLKVKLEEEYLQINNNNCYDNSNDLPSACKNNMPNIVKLLLQNPNVKLDIINDRFFYNLCVNNLPTIIEILLNDEKIKLSQPDNVLQYCFENKWNNIIKIFLNNNKYDPKLIFDYNIVLGACKNNNIEIFKLLLEDKRIIMDINNLIIYACKKENIEIVKLLLADSRITTEIKQKCITIAINYNTINIFQLLLNEKDIDYSYTFNCYIKAAIQRQNINIINLILQKINLTRELKDELMVYIDKTLICKSFKKQFKQLVDPKNNKQLDNKNLLLIANLARMGLKDEQIMDIINLNQ